MNNKQCLLLLLVLLLILIVIYCYSGKKQTVESFQDSDCPENFYKATHLAPKKDIPNSLTKCISCPPEIQNEYNYIYDGTVQKKHSGGVDGPGPVKIWPEQNLIVIDFTSCLKNISLPLNTKYNLDDTENYKNKLLYRGDLKTVVIRDKNHNEIAKIPEVYQIRQQNIQGWKPTYDRLLFYTKLENTNKNLGDIANELNSKLNYKYSDEKGKRIFIHIYDIATPLILLTKPINHKNHSFYSVKVHGNDKNIQLTENDPLNVETPYKFKDKINLSTDKNYAFNFILVKPSKISKIEIGSDWHNKRPKIVKVYGKEKGQLVEIGSRTFEKKDKKNSCSSSALNLKGDESCDRNKISRNMIKIYDKKKNTIFKELLIRFEDCVVGESGSGKPCGNGFILRHINIHTPPEFPNSIPGYEIYENKLLPWNKYCIQSNEGTVENECSSHDPSNPLACLPKMLELCNNDTNCIGGAVKKIKHQNKDGIVLYYDNPKISNCFDNKVEDKYWNIYKKKPPSEVVNNRVPETLPPQTINDSKELQNKFKGTNKKIDKKFRGTNKKIDNKFKVTNKKIDNKFGVLKDKLNENTRKSFRGTNRNINRKFKKTNENIKKLSIESEERDLESQIQINKLRNNINKKIDNKIDNMFGKLEVINSENMSKINNRIDKVIEGEETGKESQRQINKLRNNINNKIDNMFGKLEVITSENMDQININFNKVMDVLDKVLRQVEDPYIFNEIQKIKSELEQIMRNNRNNRKKSNSEFNVLEEQLNRQQQTLSKRSNIHTQNRKKMDDVIKSLNKLRNTSNLNSQTILNEIATATKTIAFDTDGGDIEIMTEALYKLMSDKVIQDAKKQAQKDIKAMKETFISYPNLENFSMQEEEMNQEEEMFGSTLGFPGPPSFTPPSPPEEEEMHFSVTQEEMLRPRPSYTPPAPPQEEMLRLINAAQEEENIGDTSTGVKGILAGNSSVPSTGELKKLYDTVIKKKGLENKNRYLTKDDFYKYNDRLTNQVGTMKNHLLRYYDAERRKENTEAHVSQKNVDVGNVYAPKMHF